MSAVLYRGSYFLVDGVDAVARPFVFVGLRAMVMMGSKYVFPVAASSGKVFDMLKGGVSVSGIGFYHLFLKSSYVWMKYSLSDRCHPVTQCVVQGLIIRNPFREHKFSFDNDVPGTKQSSLEDLFNRRAIFWY